MRFSIDAHAIGRRLTGNEVYVRNLLDAFAALDTESDFTAYVSTSEAAQTVPGRFVRRSVSGNPFMRLGCDLPRHLRADRPDLIHVQYTAPLACPVPIVVTVHDVSFLNHPEYFSSARRIQLQHTVRRTVAAATRLITPSEFSRDAIAEGYGIDPGRIAVVPNAADSRFRPISHEEAAVAVERRFAFGAPFLLTVGDLHPRKNQTGLVHAFAEMLRAHPQLKHHLVLAGQRSLRGGEARRAAREAGISDRVHFPGFVTDRELLELYNACEFFVFPSLYEGFGLPVLEAMACGRAVACSDTTAVPEVADSAAILFDPHSRREMTRALIDLALDGELRARMARLGLQRAAQFHWRKTAEQTLAVYYEVACEGRRLRAMARVAASA